MTKETLSTQYLGITARAIEPKRTIHVFLKKNEGDGKTEEISLVGIWAIADPPILNGEVRCHRCQDGTPVKEISTVPLDIFMGEKPDPEGRLWRILR